MKILIMGLSGSGKTTLAKTLKNKLKLQNFTVTHFNADAIRELYDDWDFSKDGRIRQAKRMEVLANESVSDFIICDFIAPTNEVRNIFKADITIWMDTIQKSIYEDTDKMFQKPSKYDIRVTEKNAKKWSDVIINYTMENNHGYSIRI
jgi:adenylylsulfate kinase